MSCFGLDDDCILWIILLLALLGILNDCNRRGVLGTRDKDCCC
ncbi:MAG TPA: hypothetical protein PLI11_05040 [Clostridia bacterium]|jgi:hypothetical protein|nr:hypothetical protein [Clostridia bacterium]